MRIKQARCLSHEASLLTIAQLYSCASAKASKYSCISKSKTQASDFFTRGQINKTFTPQQMASQVLAKPLTYNYGCGATCVEFGSCHQI